MPATYVNLSSTTLGANQNTITFSSIPATYTDLVLRCSTRESSDPAQTNFTFNGLSTSIYSWTNVYGTGNQVFSVLQSPYELMYISDGQNSSYTANSFSNFEIYIPSYASNRAKPFSSFSVTEQNATYSVQSIFAQNFGSTAAINSISITARINFVAGSSFYLYGIKNS